MFAGATSGRRKRLVVSGIERDNWDAIEGLQKWCEVCGHFSYFYEVSCHRRQQILIVDIPFTEIWRTAPNHTYAQRRSARRLQAF